jgi:hypothetical protein
MPRDYPTMKCSMAYPVRWDPYFRDVMTLVDIYHYPTQHFEFHRRQSEPRPSIRAPCPMIHHGFRGARCVRRDRPRRDHGKALHPSPGFWLEPGTQTIKGCMSGTDEPSQLLISKKRCPTVEESE